MRDRRFVAASLRWSAAALAAALLVGCGSDCGAPCRAGVTLYVGALAGTLAPGSSEQISVCVDDACHDVELSRSNVGGTVFVAAPDVGRSGGHTVTLTGPGAVHGDYTGPLTVFDQSGARGCAFCAIAAVEVGADGALTPGAAVPGGAATTVGG